jgi:hypothetical protein
MQIHFKKFIIITSSLFYFAGINANLLSWLEYKINYDFIVKFLCLQKDVSENLCYGSCHLKKNLEQNDEDKKPTEKPRLELNNFNITFHLIEKNLNPNKVFFITQKYSSYITQNFQSNFIQPDSPPPKLV